MAEQDEITSLIDGTEEILDEVQYKVNASSKRSEKALHLAAAANFLGLALMRLRAAKVSIPCVHYWVNGDNEAVKGVDICVNCLTLKARSDDSD